MNTSVTIVAGLLLFAFTFLLVCLLGTISGAFIGWLVQLTAFGTWAKIALEQITHANISLVDLGALLGFVGAFFRPSSASINK